MNIAICDDIKASRSTLEQYINEYLAEKNINDCSLNQFEQGTDLLDSGMSFDIAFLDIEFDNSTENGISIAKKIQQKTPNTIIMIVTSYHQYLDDAMDLKVTRYIDKPVSKERIFSALNKAFDELSEKILTVHIKNSDIIRLNVSSIIYAESKLKKVILVTDDNKYVVTESLKQIRDFLPTSLFAVPHNSFVVNMNYIKNFRRTEIVLSLPQGNVVINVSTRKQAEFKRQFLTFIGEDYNNE